MPFRYCPESAFLNYTPTVVQGSAVTGYPVTHLTDYYRPDLVFEAATGALTVRATLSATAEVAAVALLDPSWVATAGLTLGGTALNVGLNTLDQRRGGLWENDPPSDLSTVDLVVPNGVMTRGSTSTASTLIVCGEWNEIGTNPVDPIQRRRINTEPASYLVLEEDWRFELTGQTDVARWQTIRQEWEQVYLWEEDGPDTAPYLMLGQLTQPPSINLARGEGGITEVNCTWRTIPAPLNVWARP